MTRLPGADTLEGWEKARLARTALGVGPGPLPDILPLVEDGPLAVNVCVLPLPEGVAGAYRRHPDTVVVFVNQNEGVPRQRFTLAHEFGHHFCGHGSAVDPDAVINGRTRKPTEIQANAFAAELLVPRDSLRDWIERRGFNPGALESVCRAADYFGTSARVIVYRLDDAGLLKPSAKRHLEDQLAAGAHSTLASRLGLTGLTDTLTSVKARRRPRVPRRLAEDAMTGYEHGIIPLQRLAAMLRRDPDEVSAELAQLGVAPPELEPDW